jgi:hypothetical protein
MKLVLITYTLFPYHKSPLFSFFVLYIMVSLYGLLSGAARIKYDLYFSAYFTKMKVGLSSHQYACVSVCVHHRQTHRQSEPLVRFS